MVVGFDILPENLTTVDKCFGMKKNHHNLYYKLTLL